MGQTQCRVGKANVSYRPLPQKKGMKLRIYYQWARCAGVSVLFTAVKSAPGTVSGTNKALGEYFLNVCSQGLENS